MFEAGTFVVTTADGVERRVTYQRAGRGTPLLLIHGVGVQAAVWRPQIQALSNRFDVIAPDLLGHGGSSLPPDRPELRDYAAAILGLLDGLGLEHVVVVGHSMGALVALELALNAPDRVIGVVAMNSVFCRSPEQSAAIGRRVSELSAGSGPIHWGSTMARWFGAPVPDELASVAAFTARLLAANDRTGYERTYALFARADSAHCERLASLAVPALFLTAEGDTNSTPAMSRRMAELAPRSEVMVIPGHRHMMSLTAADAVSRILSDFVEAQTGAPAASIEPRALRNALGTFLTGVTVVATLQADGQPRGFTANSFSSVSLDPPLVLVCIARTAASFRTFSEVSHFSVNVLSEQQQDASVLFASKAPDKFSQISWTRGPAGSPVLADVAAWFDCTRYAEIPAGDHIVLIGRVMGFGQAAGTHPLGYCKGAYVTLGRQLDPLMASGQRIRIGAILEREGMLALLDDGAGGLCLPTAETLGRDGAPDGLLGRIRALGLSAELEFVFAVFEDRTPGNPALSVFYRGTLQGGAASPRVRCTRFEDVPWVAIKEAAVRSMLQRYIEERQEDLFGIYVGDAGSGVVARLGLQAPSTTSFHGEGQP